MCRNCTTFNVCWVIDEVASSSETQWCIMMCRNCTTIVCWVVDEVGISSETQWCVVKCINCTTWICWIVGEVAGSTETQWCVVTGINHTTFTKLCWVLGSYIFVPDEVGCSGDVQRACWCPDCYTRMITKSGSVNELFMKWMLPVELRLQLIM